MDHIRKEDMAWISEIRDVEGTMTYRAVNDELIDGQVWASEATDLLLLKGWKDDQLVIEHTETNEVIN